MHLPTPRSAVRPTVAFLVFLGGGLLAPARSEAQAADGANPTADLLSQLIQLDTSNPPGRTAKEAEFLAPRFRALGFEVKVIPTPDSAKAHFVARLRGDGSKRPVLLTAHADVVGVERDKWTVDPFGGVLRDGYVYGRGAIDVKGGAAVFARAVMRLAENHVPLARDVIFLAEADEESGPYGTSWLAENHWPDIDSEFALNEGGWIMNGPDGGVRYVSISTADKIFGVVTLTATGTSTHSSIPRGDNAIYTLSRALARLSDYDTPVTLIPSTRRFFRTLATTSEPPMSQYFQDVTGDDPEGVARADREISRDPLLHAFLHNTIAPTLLDGGFRVNVIPGSAQATLNVRLIPGTDPHALVDRIRAVVDDPRVTVQLESPRELPDTPPSSVDTDLFRALASSAQEEWPGAEVTPYLFQASTDAGAWRSRGVPVYGIYPYPIDPDDLTRMHGNDERVSVESLRQGTDMIYRALVEVAGK